MMSIFFETLSAVNSQIVGIIGVTVFIFYIWYKNTTHVNRNSLGFLDSDRIILTYSCDQHDHDPSRQIRAKKKKKKKKSRKKRQCNTIVNTNICKSSTYPRQNTLQPQPRFLLLSKLNMTQTEDNHALVSQVNNEQLNSFIDCCPPTRVHNTDDNATNDDGYLLDIDILEMLHAVKYQIFPFLIDNLIFVTDCNVREQLWGKVMSALKDDKINERMICVGVAIIDCCRQCGDEINGILNFAEFLRSNDTNFAMWVPSFLKEYMDSSLGKKGQQDLYYYTWKYFQRTQEEYEICSLNP